MQNSEVFVAHLVALLIKVTSGINLHHDQMIIDTNLPCYTTISVLSYPHKLVLSKPFYQVRVVCNKGNAFDAGGGYWALTQISVIAAVVQVIQKIIL